MLGLNDSVMLVNDDDCRNGSLPEIPGMTSLKDGDFQHSCALAQFPDGNIEPNHPAEINPNSDSRSKSDGRSRRYCNTG